MNPEVLDIDNLTDAEMEQILNDIQTGKYDNRDEEKEDSEEDESTGTDSVASTDSEDDDSSGEDDEDTENDESDEDEAGTNDDDDGQDQDTDTESEDEDSENTLVEKAKAGKDNIDDESVSGDDGAAAENSSINVAEYERYKKFYEQVANVEFVANGKKVKGFTDPEKIKQAQQMAYGFGDKMASLKQYRPFMTSLKDRGMLEDTAKFNFAMDLLDGDTEALKKHLQLLNVDPLDLDMDAVAYSGKNHITSNEALILEDTIEQARNYGVEEKLRSTIGKTWDQESFNEFLTVPEVRRDLLEHMATGAFDLVQDKIAEMKTLDVSGSYTQMKATDQYRQAVQALTAEAARINREDTAAKEATAKTAVPRSTGKTNADLVEKQEAEYKRNLEAKNRQAEDARKKAVSVSKKKTSSTSTKKFDPLALDGKEFDAYVDSLIRS